MSEERLLAQIRELLDARFEAVLAKLDAARELAASGDAELGQRVYSVEQRLSSHSNSIKSTEAALTMLERTHAKDVSELERRVGQIVHERVEEALEESKEHTGAATQSLPAISDRLTVLEDRWKVIRGIVIGLSVGQLASLGAALALLADLMG